MITLNKQFLTVLIAIIALIMVIFISYKKGYSSGKEHAQAIYNQAFIDGIARKDYSIGHTLESTINDSSKSIIKQVESKQMIIDLESTEVIDEKWLEYLGGIK